MLKEGVEGEKDHAAIRLILASARTMRYILNTSDTRSEAIINFRHLHPPVFLHSPSGSTYAGCECVQGQLREPAA